MQISAECMREDVAQIAEQQRAIGYESTFVEGARESDGYMKSILYDWQARGITSVLHEKKGGYANNTKSMYGLAGKAEAEGVRIITGLTVTGFQCGNGSDAITAVETEQGAIRCDYVVIGIGPWIKSIWEMLALPKSISVKGRDGRIHHDIPMWVYWFLQEDTLGVDPNLQRANDGGMPPVIHVDTDAPLYSEVDGSLITDQLCGIYYKPDFTFGGVQGGRCPTRSKPTRTR